jgi:SAM-dependent methyltransferase
VTGRAQHWDRVYTTRNPSEVSWYEREPAMSLRLIESIAAGRPLSVLDVGGGASMLVDRLAARSFTDVTVLDVSSRVLEAVRDRLGGKRPGISLVAGDVLTWNTRRTYDVWHDRAVFHFLTDPSDRVRYVDVAERATAGDGHLILGTFAEDGPERCSDLPVSRYSAPGLLELFSRSFTLVAREREEHVTPSGAVQPFTWVVLRRTDGR